MATSIKCPGCGMVNFAGPLSCKRCSRPFVEQSGEQVHTSQDELSAGSLQPAVNDKPRYFGSDPRREGEMVIVTEESVLPERCVSCNAPTTRRVKRKLAWMPLYVGLVGFIHWLPMVILMVTTHESAAIEIGLCDRHYYMRLVGMILGGGSIVLGLVLGLIIVFNNDYALLSYSGGALLVGGVLVVILTPTVTAKRIELPYVWLKGAHRDFLDSLSS